MSAIIKLIGLILILFAGYNLFATFQDQILGEAVKSQTPDFLDFFVDTATPDVTSEMITNGIIFGVIFLVGLVMLVR